MEVSLILVKVSTKGRGGSKIPKICPRGLCMAPVKECRLVDGGHGDWQSVDGRSLLLKY